jgi:UDP-2,4-diacetamido-2,4,6-trideoxy-beta-L-altropyranose hydrolase
LNHPVFIRVDASPSMGLGHLVRCLALAQMLKDNFSISFFCIEIPENSILDIQHHGFNFVPIQNESQFLDQLNRNIIVVLDGYHFTTDYQKEIKSKNAKLVCIDELNDKEFYSDIIINYVPGFNPKDYRAAKYTQFAFGLGFTLLRPSFLEQLNKHRIIKNIENVLISFGGSDPKNLTLKVLEAVLELNKFNKIIAITGPSYRITHEFLNLISANKNVDHRFNQSEQQMLSAMLETELSIVPASGVSLESICGKTNLLICYTAENQIQLHNCLVNDYGFISFGDNTNELQKDEMLQKLENLNIFNVPRIDEVMELLNNVQPNISTLFYKLALQNDN